MKLALIGYGKMGQAIERVAVERGHLIVARLSRTWRGEEIEEADLCIEFTDAQGAIENIAKIIEKKKNLVIGTTGWYGELESVKNLVREADVGALYAPNFSVGVHLFLEIVRRAARLIAPHIQYDVAGLEAHHKEKKDAPSGTALAMAQVIKDEMNRECLVSAQRCGYIPGIHRVTFDSPEDQIVIEHTARGREGFACGAVQAAEWLQGRKGFYTLNDIFDP